MEQHLQTSHSQEIQKFSDLSGQWWDESGPFKLLHSMNPVRLEFIKSHLCSYFKCDTSSLSPLKGLKILDVGCGGGILAEPLCRLGAQVTGIDASSESIAVAIHHAKGMGLEIQYINDSLGSLIETEETFDVVISLEVLEHVENVDCFLKSCSDLVVPKGAIIVSTLNRTPQSYVGAIVMAEHVLRWVPKRTHNWKKFLKPSELVQTMTRHSLKALKISGMIPTPLTQKWVLSEKLAVNYIVFGVKK